MCPMRFILVFFSAILAGYVAWKTVRSVPDAADHAMFTEEDSSNQEKEFNLIKMLQNGFWVFVDMASGRYLWRNLREMKKGDTVKSS